MKILFQYSSSRFMFNEMPFICELSVLTETILGNSWFSYNLLKLYAIYSCKDNLSSPSPWAIKFTFHYLHIHTVNKNWITGAHSVCTTLEPCQRKFSKHQMFGSRSKYVEFIAGCIARDKSLHRVHTHKLFIKLNNSFEGTDYQLLVFETDSKFWRAPPIQATFSKK